MHLLCMLIWNMQSALICFREAITGYYDKQQTIKINAMTVHFFGVL